MEKITMEDFEARIAKDEALAAKAKEITGEADELKEKIKAFAASLGYELESGAKARELDLDEVENIAGGGILDPMDSKTILCKKLGHDWEFLRREKGFFFGYNTYYQCKRCGDRRKSYD